MARKTVKSFEKDFLDSRFDSMQKFLRAVCDHPVLRKSPAVVAFLKSETQEKYNQARAAIDS